MLGLTAGFTSQVSSGAPSGQSVTPVARASQRRSVHLAGLGFLAQPSALRSLSLDLNSVERMCCLRKITVDNSMAFLPSLARVIGINEIFTSIYEYVLIVVGS